MATAIMKQKEVPEMDDVEEIISKISEESPYKRHPTQKRTWMTVPEMGKLLGLKKTDRYWLVHKNVFESKEIAGKIRINIASFEKQYANQIKYYKVTGEEPGKELKSWSYSVKEVADLLDVDDYLVYELLKKNQMEAVIVDINCTSDFTLIDKYKKICPLFDSKAKFIKFFIRIVFEKRICHK